jgi:hypothetical protein
MPPARESFDYRRRLLSAVRGFQRGTPTARLRAERIVAAFPDIKAFTIADIVWDTIHTALTVPLVQVDPEYLEDLHQFLSRSSRIIRQGYLSYDVRSWMTPQEQACYAHLQELLAFLERFPFADLDDAVAEYDRRCAAITPVLADVTAPVSEYGHDEQETIYHLVLREVATVALNIDMRWSMFDGTHLAPAPKYVDVRPYQPVPFPPDATTSVVWARKALRAIAGEDWLYFSWQLSDSGVQFSLH